MRVYPAIDIRGGRTVRLVQGDYRREVAFDLAPVEAARRWVSGGASALHVVDLDGAREGRPVNRRTIASIVAGVDVAVQVGGGVRRAVDARYYLELGVSRVVLGTVAVTEPVLLERLTVRYPGRILVSVDCRDGLVAVRGWRTDTSLAAADVARRAADLGVEEIVFTDIGRDGTLGGPDLASLEAILRGGIRVIAAGGVSGVEDIRALRVLEGDGLVGVIIGRALYSGAMSLGEALAAAGEEG